jgi:hypothetical protein
LLDALAANTGVSSVAELSLSPLFSRTYNSVYKAIKESFDTSNTDRKKRRKLLKNLTRTVASVVPKPNKRPFYLIAPDTTPHPRPYSRTMPEVGYIYQPNTVAGNKPINIGHNYSIVCALPEKNGSDSSSWSIPLSGERVPIESSGVRVASKQIKTLMSDESLPWYGELTVVVADSTYSQRSFLFEQCKHKNLVVVARVRSNRIFYQSPPIQQEASKRGCPKKFGERFNLADESTWHPSNETVETKHTTRSGRQLTVTIQAWHQMLMRGTKTELMYRHPFTLMRVSVADDTDKLVWKPMWLIMMGERLSEISPLVAYQSYRERFGIEHFFRFGKQRLLMTQFQTPELEHEENWIRLVLLAYVQLWAARELATQLPKPL